MENETKAHLIRSGASWDIAHQETMVSIPPRSGRKCPFQPQAVAAEANAKVALAREEIRHER